MFGVGRRRKNYKWGHTRQSDSDDVTYRWRWSSSDISKMKFNGHRLTQQWWLPFLNEFYATIHKFPYINPLRLFIALTSNNIETIAAKRDKNDYNLFPRIKTGTRMSSSHFSPTTIFIDLFFFLLNSPFFFCLPSSFLVLRLTTT